jgi:GntR family transcriptional regulator, rspAB operon transcriptional repressor
MRQSLVQLTASNSLAVARALGKAKLDRQRLLSQQVYDIVRQLILTGVLSAGESIDEKAIANELSVSRTPVREALKRLASEHLVETKAQSRTTVGRIDRKLIHEAFLIRRALEVECIGHAATRMSEQGSEQLAEINRRHVRAIERRRFVEAIGFDDDFHRMISQIADLPWLWHAIEVSKAQLDRCRYLTVPQAGQAEATITQHRAILEALIARDPDGARQAMQAHLELAYHGIVAFLDQTTAQSRNGGETDFPACPSKET